MSDENEDCNCDQALALIETVNRLVKERDEARREVDAMRSRMDRIAALCEKADEAEWDSAILHFADIFDITEEAASAIECGDHRKEKTNSDKYRVLQGPHSGVAAIIGKWPGGETDDEIADALRKDDE